MKSQNNKGLLALLGIGAGAWAFWKYRNMSPNEKRELKSSLNEVGNKIKKKVDEIESTVTDNYERSKDSAKEKLKDIKR